MYIMDKYKSHYLKMNEPLSSNNFLSVLNKDITLFMNLWKYLLSCLCGADVCSDGVGESDSDMLCEGLFLGGPAGEAEISASASRTRRTTCTKKILKKLQLNLTLICDGVINFELLSVVVHN